MACRNTASEPGCHNFSSVRIAGTVKYANRSLCGDPAQGAPSFILLSGFRDYSTGPLDGQTNPVLDDVPILQKQRLSEYLISNPRVAPVAAFGLAMLATLCVTLSVERASRAEQHIAMIERGQAVTSRFTIAEHQWMVKSGVLSANVFSQTGMLILLAGLIIASLLLFIVRLAIQQALFDRQQLLVRQEQHAIRATLTRELNHRVKNTLANVLSILSLSRRNAEDLDSFVETFTGRVQALSATHNLLMQTSWGPTSVTEIVQTEMAPYFHNDPPRIKLEGTDAVIAPNDALSLGLLIHELVTNAAKYGALSNASGTVTLAWDLTQDHRILFNWREEGGPPPLADRCRGFGSDLIEKVISRDLHSDIKLEFAATGVRVSFAVPIRQVSAFVLRQDS